MAELSATGPVLVHFFDFAQLNSVRALPYVREWHRRYTPHGLTVLGVHSPRFRFSAGSEAAAAGVGALGVEYPVAVDSGYQIWHDYGVKGWPSLFLWGRGGALAWAHFGEGEYRATEEAIQDTLRSEDVTFALPATMEPIRATDVPGALLPPPTPELFPGGSPAEPWTPASGGEAIEVAYEAGGAWAVAEGEGSLAVIVDDDRPERLPSAPTGLVALAKHPRHESHRLRLEVGDGVRVWAISFEPGAP